MIPPIDKLLDEIWKECDSNGLQPGRAGVHDAEDMILFALRYLRSNMHEVFEEFDPQEDDEWTP